MKNTLKRLFSLKKENITVSRILQAIWRRVTDIPETMQWRLPLAFTLANRQKLEKFKDIHKGRRCFILATGPSLQKIDFSLLKNDITIGMNRIYLMKEQNGFVPTYLACIDVDAHLMPFLNDYDQLEIPCFYNWKVRRSYSKKNNQVFVKDSLQPDFVFELSKNGFGSGNSVTYLTMQLAFYMGFSEVYLVGKDHSYATNLKSGLPIVSTREEKNHFIKGYYQPGMKWFAPDYETEEFAYKLARSAFEKNGRTIKDATIGGQLTVFEKVDFASLFSKVIKMLFVISSNYFLNSI